MLKQSILINNRHKNVNVSKMKTVFLSEYVVDLDAVVYLDQYREYELQWVLIKVTLIVIDRCWSREGNTEEDRKKGTDQEWWNETLHKARQAERERALCFNALSDQSILLKTLPIIKNPILFQHYSYKKTKQTFIHSFLFGCHIVAPALQHNR